MAFQFLTPLAIGVTSGDSVTQEKK